ncbi:HNH endonuclease [Micromonospora aurantiaca (nom. illeg.)]|uniref:HNH endonuclease n=1 Tax=Micromonospora aurantiaca (nom. illeg.) TaxID=47850 RepID=UPI003F4A2F05
MTEPLRPCGVCRRLHPGGRCPQHPPTSRQYRPHRPRYSSRWARLSRRLLATAPPCSYCTTTPATSCDHVIPRSRGGADHPDNAVPCCRTCNGAKADRTLAEWVATGQAPVNARALLIERERYGLPC